MANFSTVFVSAAEAAYLAGTSAARINRLYDDHLVPRELVAREGGDRRFAPLAAAYAMFIEETEDYLKPAARRSLLDDFTRRVRKQALGAKMLALQSKPAELDFRVEVGPFTVHLESYIDKAMARARSVAAADRTVSVDPEVMGGLPCFAGTRVPIDNVLVSLEQGTSMVELVEAYPFLTDKHVAGAKLYAQLHPKRGRPRRLAQADAPLTVVRCVVKPIKA